MEHTRISAKQPETQLNGKITRNTHGPLCALEIGRKKQQETSTTSNKQNWTTTGKKVET